jgi:tetratricopeptide (TPR) repeat protein
MLRQALTAKLGGARLDAEARDSPLFQLIPDFPGIDLPHAATESFRDRARAVDAIRDRLDLARRSNNVDEISAIAASIDPRDPANAETLVDVLLSYRDLERYAEMIELIQRAPGLIERSVTIREQFALALNRRNQGDDRERALKILAEIVRANGDSPETCGIVGRIYKDRYKEALRGGERRQALANLERACEWYRRGFMADPRDYYPGVNLITALAWSNTEASLAELRSILPAVSFAVARLGGLQTQDYWQIATVMELAIHGNDRATADRALTRLLALDRAVPPMALTTMADQLQTIRDIEPKGMDLDGLDLLIADLRKAAG